MTQYIEFLEERLTLLAEIVAGGTQTSDITHAANLAINREIAQMAMALDCMKTEIAKGGGDGRAENHA